MIYSRRALLALFAVLALSSAASVVLAQPPDAPAAPVSPLQARRAEREAEKEAAAAAAAAPAPAPAKAKKAKNATASGADALLPATGKTNTKYFVSARSALYTPAPKGSDKPGTLKLEGLIQTILGEVHSNDRADSNIGRVTAAQLFNGAKVKERLPVFDKKEGGMDVLLLGDRGKNASSLFLVISRPRGFKDGKDSSVEFDATPLTVAKEEADNSDVKLMQGLTRPGRIADAAAGQKVRLEQVVAMITAYAPQGDAVLKRAKEIAAGTYEKPKKAAKKAAKKDADAAEAPSPAAAPLAEKVKNATAAAKDAVVEKAGAAKEKVVEAADKVAAGRKLLSFADLNPNNGRRLLQQNCGICEYADKSGACKVAPASLDCDGIVGMSGEWNCGTCETYTNNDFLGYCETIPDC